jgi:integrase
MTSGLSPADKPWSAPFAPNEYVLPEERRVAPGPRPVFSDMPRWDLSAGGLAPNLNAAQAHLRFDDLPEDWVPIAKTLAMAMLNPTHPVVRAAGIYRSNQPYKLKSINHALFELRYLARWATEHGHTNDLSQWPDELCNSCLDTVRATRAISATHSAHDLLRHLVAFGALMEGGGLHATVGSSKSARTTGEIKTPVIPPDAFWPLVRACWTYIDVFAPDIIAARDELEALDHTESTGSRPTTDAVNTTIDAWLSSADAFVPLHVYSVGRARAGEINLDGLALVTTPRIREANFYGPHGAMRKQKLCEAITRGVPTRYGFTTTRPTTVDRSDGTNGPWQLGFDRFVVRKELTQLRNAAYIFVAIMTMMRDSEVEGIAAGAIRHFYGAPAVESLLHKGQSPEGTRQRWWISPPVVHALEVAERITRDPTRHFGSMYGGVERQLTGFDQYEQIRSFVAWVNENAPQTGLTPIPRTALAPHMFRRTMAVITANEPDGEIALGITLKHNATRALANATTSGYGAPTPEWALEFEHHAKEATAGELVADWARHAQGERTARGPGAATFVQGLDDVTKQAGTPVAIGNERMLRDLLRDKFSTIRLGTLNHCLGDPAKALCLENASEAVKSGGPIPSMCQPSTCRNSVITDAHLPLWQHEEADLIAKLKDKSMATIHRERLESQLADIRRITMQEPK